MFLHVHRSSGEVCCLRGKKNVFKSVAIEKNAKKENCTEYLTFSDSQNLLGIVIM